MTILDQFQAPWKDALGDALVKYGSVIGQGPVGFGKTTTFIHMVKDAIPLGHRILVSVPDKVLIDQVSIPFLEAGIRHGFISSGYPELPQEQVQIATPQTFLNRKDRVGKFTLAIKDECHGDMSATQQELNHWLDSNGCDYRLGVTATPCRLDGKGLKHQYKHMVPGPQPEQLIETGRLAQPLYYAPPVVADLSKLEKTGYDYSKRSLDQVLNTKKVNANAVEMYQQIAPGTKFLVFCSTVSHAKNIADEFTKAGYPCGVLEGSMSQHERRQMIKALEDGTLCGIASCELITQGFDMPSAVTLIDLRKTQSLRLFIQSRGRVMRGDGGKKSECYIIDLVANVYRFGMPDADREWSLEGGSGAASYKSKLRQCPVCYLWNRVGTPACRCGREFKAEEKEYKTEKGGYLVVVEDIAAKMKAPSKLDDYKAEEKLIKKDDPQAYEKIKALVAKYGYDPKFAKVRWRMKSGAAFRNQWAKKKKGKSA